MPGLVKVGYTEKDPDVRAKELSSDTGVPGNTEIKYAAWVEDVITVERNLHQRFDDTRVLGKEWFEIEIGDAIDVLKTLCNPIFEDIRVPLVVVCCPECGKRHRLPPNQEGTVRCKDDQCNYVFVTSTMSEAESGEREITELRVLLDRRTADWRELCNHPIIRYAIHLDDDEEVVELESDELEIEHLKAVLDEQIHDRQAATVTIAELKDSIRSQREEIEVLEEEVEYGRELPRVYAACQNCGEINKVEWEWYEDEDIKLKDTLCPSCGYNL